MSDYKYIDLLDRCFYSGVAEHGHYRATLPAEAADLPAGPLPRWSQYTANRHDINMELGDVRGVPERQPGVRYVVPKPVAEHMHRNGRCDITYPRFYGGYSECDCDAITAASG